MARLPFLQVPQQATACARMLARALRVPEFQGIGLAVALDAWALEMAPDDDLSGTIPPGDPAALVALAVGWEGDAAALLAALLTVGFLVREGEVIRYPHLSKYEGAIGSPAKRSEHARKAAHARWSTAHAMPTDAHACSGMPNDAKTQTQTQKKEKQEALSAPADLFSVATGQKAPKRAKPEPKTSEAEREARARLEAVYTEKRDGEVLPWDGGAWVSLRECLVLAGGDVAKVAARFARGLDLAAAKQWGGASTIHQLKVRWADLASLEAAPQAASSNGSPNDERARALREAVRKAREEEQRKAAGGGA